MRKLARTPAPACLRRFRHGRDSWGTVSQADADKEEIWQQLEAMQGKFCAYCQRLIRQKQRDAHIEHFFRRSSSPQKTFSWDNLFGSCNDNNTCGKHKDNNADAKQIDPAQICKPDSMDPADYLLFLPDGLVQPKSGLAPEQATIANNTIIAFNLNCPSLKGRRRSAVASEKGHSAGLFEFMELMPDDADLWQERQKHLSRINSSEDFSAARLSAWCLQEAPYNSINKL